MDEQDIVDLYVKDLKPITEISRICNITQYNVRKILQNKNIVIRQKLPWNKGRKFDKDTFEYTLQVINNDELQKRCTVNVRKHMKRYLLGLKGHKCEICGLSEWNKAPIPLVCDHINGDSTDSRIENFRLICCNCDAQLPTYKSKNRKIGDKYNREYYHKRKNGSVTEQACRDRLENGSGSEEGSGEHALTLPPI